MGSSLRNVDVFKRPWRPNKRRKQGAFIDCKPHEAEGETSNKRAPPINTCRRRPTREGQWHHSGHSVEHVMRLYSLDLMQMVVALDHRWPDIQASRADRRQLTYAAKAIG